MIDETTLMTGVDVPFVSAELVIHQPTLKEIGLISEKAYFKGLDILTTSKERINSQGKFDLDDTSNFHIFMTIMSEGQQDEEMSESMTSVMMLLTLLFASYDLQFTEQGIMLKKENETPKFITSMNFDDFQTIIQEIFCLNDPNNKLKDYNPAGPKAREIAEKLKQRRERLNKGKKQDFTFYKKMISILSVALHKTPNEIIQCTIYQIHELFNRVNKKESWDTYISAKIQGASGMDDTEHWLNDLFSDK